MACSSAFCTLVLRSEAEYEMDRAVRLVIIPVVRVAWLFGLNLYEKQCVVSSSSP